MLQMGRKKEVFCVHLAGFGLQDESACCQARTLTALTAQVLGGATRQARYTSGRAVPGMQVGVPRIWPATLVPSSVRFERYIPVLAPAYQLHLENGIFWQLPD